MTRKSIYSTAFRILDTPAGPVTVYIVDDLPDEVLQYHYDMGMGMGMDKEDWEYVTAVAVEADSRRLFIKT